MKHKGQKEQLLAAVQRLPQTPGVYIMKGAGGAILYIGKAINLRSRVSSYFSDSHTDRIQIPKMVRKIERVDFIATAGQSEALILEANLVREHKPPYNVDLKDDKHFPYLKVTVNEPFPRLLVVRRVAKDKTKYFGPYTDVRTMRNVMAFAKKAFKIRDCNKPLPLKKPIRACINYSIGRCSGACAGLISQEDYSRNVDLLLTFLRGRRAEVVTKLRTQMECATNKLEFERAAELRDQFKLIESFTNMQNVDLRSPDTDSDVFGFHERHDSICLCVLCFRQGVLLDKRHFLANRERWHSSEDSLDAVILQYYHHASREIPDELLLPDAVRLNTGILALSIGTRYGGPVKVSIPQRGTKLRLVEMANNNARLFLEQRMPRGSIALLKDLQSVLNLPDLPRVIEAFDISNLGESFTVAAMVQFVEGRPNKKGYRRFKIKTVEGQNDFAMMMEAVARRLFRLRDEQKSMPDLLLIDGGKGQLSSARKALEAFEDPPMIVSLAKKEEILFSPYADDPIQLPVTHEARKLVQRIRDEVHRFAIAYHRNLRGKQFRRSSLENIPGLGPKRAVELLKKFGSIKKLKEATVEEVASVPGISQKLAESILQGLNG